MTVPKDLQAAATEDLELLHIMWQGEIGGAERAVFQLALHQHLQGTRRVGIAYCQGRGRYVELAREHVIPVIDLALRSGRDILGVRKAARVLSAIRIHHLHSVELPIIVASSSIPNAGRVYTHRGGLSPYSGMQAMRYRVAAPFIRRRFVVTGNTRHGATAARHLFAIPADVEVPATYNGLDFGLLVPRIDRREVREKIGAPKDTVVIGTAANLRAWKRIDWLIAAAAQIAKGDWEVWVVGDGPDRCRLEQLARASCAGPRIRFVGKQHHIADWLHAMDIFVLPSGPLESFGNAAVEAMACGLPTIVAQSSPGLVEHVERDMHGFVIDGIDDLAQRLRELVADTDLRARMGAAARAHVRSTYTMERALGRYEAVYRSLDVDRGSSSGSVAA